MIGPHRSLRRFCPGGVRDRFSRDQGASENLRFADAGGLTLDHEEAEFAALVDWLLRK
jgi:hypothetical protein